MSCTSCTKIIDPDIPFIKFDYTTTTQIARSALVKRPARPTKGWSVVLPINGQPQRIDGINPYDVAGNAKKLIKLNGFQVDDNDLWLNLNIQWLQNTPTKYRRVSLESLLNLATGEELKNEDPHAVQKNTNWLNTVRDYVNLYLTAENYHWNEFVVLLERIQKYLDPVENPLLGDSNKYISFTKSLAKVKNGPLYDREDAKSWFNALEI